MSMHTPTRGARLAVAAVLAAATVAAGAAISSSGGNAPAAPTAAARAAASLVAGIPEHNGVLGDPSAPVTVTEYVDLQCPICAAAARDTLPPLVREYVKTGKAKLELRTLHFIGPDSERAATVAAGAERQNRLWPFVEAFYASQGAENSGYVTDGFLRKVSAASGVDADAALGQAGSSFARSRIQRADSDAARLGVNATPTFTVARGDGAPQVVDARSLFGALEKVTK